MGGALNNFRKNWLCSIEELKPVIHELSASPVIAEKVLEMYLTWNDVTSSHFNIEEFTKKDLFDSGKIPENGRQFFIRLFNTWCVNILKECFYFHNKRQLCFSPFSNKWLLSKTSIAASNKRGTFRCTLFEDETIDFIEISNIGFLNSPCGYILPTRSYSFLKTRVHENPSTWFSDERVDKGFWTAAIDALRLAPEDALKDSYLLLNSNPSSNLGHLLWNTISGVYSFEKVCSQLGYFVDYKIGVLGASNQSNSRFSEVSSADIFIDFLKYKTKSTNSFLVIESHSHKSPDYSFINDYLNISFKSLFMQKNLTEIYREFFSSIDVECGLDWMFSPAQTIIFCNVRTHNKALLNIGDCIDALCKKIDYLGPGNASFIFEGDLASINEIEALIKICTSYNIPAQKCCGLNVYELYEVVSHVDLVIAPVGSGLVIPTWICNTDCVTYGDPAHMTQLAWWDSVTEPHLKLSSFPLDDIFPVSEQGYSSYSIPSQRFAEKIINRLKDISREKST